VTWSTWVAVGDVIRVANAVFACALIFACAFAITVSRYPDQRVRFGILALFGVLLTSGHLSSLGTAWSWRLPVLFPVVVAALISTVIYVRRERRTQHDDQ
jgi:predicted membrane protein